MRDYARQRTKRALIGVLLAATFAMGGAVELGAQTKGSPISISPIVPSELNAPFAQGPPLSGGAPSATPEQAAAFAWQEFIALNWPAGPQQGMPGQRDRASSTYRFGDPTYSGPLVWETFRGKVEIFPGKTKPISQPPFREVLPPPGFPGPPGDAALGYDALPTYNYSSLITACNSHQNNDPTPWINLDETDQITLDNMYAGVVQPNVSPGNSSPQLVRFLAKANRFEYVYVAKNSTLSDPTKLWWGAIPKSVVDATKAYLKANRVSPPAGSNDLVSQPNGTIEVKAGWRPLNPSEAASGRFHTQRVRFYELAAGGQSKCYVDATWGLIALHIIQKTPSAPYFIYATFEQADNLLTANGQPVEDVDGNIRSPQLTTSRTPQVCLMDARPPVAPPPPNGEEVTSQLGSVILTADPASCEPAQSSTYCGAPGNRLYYRNKQADPPQNGAPYEGNICVNKRDNAIPDYAIEANRQAHAAMAAYLKQAGIASAPWLSYKLINVQYYPYDKVPVAGAPNGSLYVAQPPFTATNPAPSSYYQANIVVETNRSLQLFGGGLSPNISTDWNQDGSPHKNTYYGGHFDNMGGCMGCHGSQGQNPLIPYGAGDFSVILARGSVTQPETPSMATSQGMTAVFRNRSLSR